jgi:hypothetical protein
MVGWLVFFLRLFFVLSLGEVYIVIHSSLLAAGMVLSVELYHFWPDFRICWCGFLSYYHGLLWSLLCLQGVLSCGLFLFFVKTLGFYSGCIKYLQHWSSENCGHWELDRWSDQERQRKKLFVGEFAKVPIRPCESFIWGRIRIVRSWELVVVATLNLLGNWQSYGRRKL